jgi:ribosome-binding factor A
VSKPSRAERVAREVQRELADLVRREVKDPRVGFVTITRVEVSADLREAKAYFMPLGDAADRDEVAAGLTAAAPFLQGRLGRQLRLRSTPRLTFAFDRGMENLHRVHDVLRELDEAKGADRDGGDEA